MKYMFLIIIKLLPHEISLLREEKILPKTLNFQLTKGESYGFYYHRRLYGVYRVKTMNKKYYFLSKNHYRPLKLFGSNEIKEKFLSQTEQDKAVWKTRNHLHGHLLMTSVESEVKYFFKFHHHLLPGFEKILTINKTREVQTLIKKSIKLLSTFNSPPLSELKEMGSRLFELGGFEKILPIISHRVTYTPHSSPFPLEIIYNPNNQGKAHQGWIWIENPIHYFYKPELVRRRLNSFTLFNTRADSFMIEEEEAIKQVLKYKPNFSAQFLTGGQKEILAKAMNSDILHLIAHGKEKSDNNFHFLLNKQEEKQENLFTLKDITRMPQTPAFIFLSNCYSNHPHLREAFFKRRTQTLITSQGPLFSSNLSKVVSEFYRRLLSEKITVLESYHLMIKKLAYLDDINAVKLRLHGYGQERLYSFKQ